MKMGTTKLSASLPSRSFKPPLIAKLVSSLIFSRIKRGHLALLTKSYGLQNKLSEYFKRKRGSGGLIQVESVEGSFFFELFYSQFLEEIEEQYKTSMQKVDELTNKLKKVGSDCKTDLEMFLERCEEKRVSVNGDYERVLDKKRKISQSCIVPRSGRPVTSKGLKMISKMSGVKNEPRCC
jgi:hypothetical protein